MLPAGFLEQILSNHNSRQILLLLAKIFDLFNEPSDRWEKAKVIFDKSWNSQANFIEKENFPLDKLEELIGDDQSFLIDLRSSGLVRNDPNDPVDTPTRTLTGIQIVELDFGVYNFWITKKSFLYLLEQISVYESGKSWTLGKLNNEIKFFKNLLVPNQDKRINFVNEKSPLGSFPSEDMELISINTEIIPSLHEIFKYSDLNAKFEFSEQLELDEALVGTERELTKRLDQVKTILKRVSPFLLTKEFLKIAYGIIDSLGDLDANILQNILNNNPSFKEKLNIHFDDETNLPSWTKSIGEVLKYKKIFDEQKEKYELLMKEKIMTLNYQDVIKLINNHSDISDQLKKIDNEIQRIEADLSRIEGKLKVTIKLD